VKQNSGQASRSIAPTPARFPALCCRQCTNHALHPLTEARVSLNDAAVARKTARQVRRAARERPRIPPVLLRCLQRGGAMEAPHGVDARGQQGGGAAGDEAGGGLHGADVGGAGLRAVREWVGAVEGRGGVGQVWRRISVCSKLL
jgi:hypothetical protein